MSAEPSPLPADAAWPHRSVRCGDCGRVSILGPVLCPACGGHNLASTELMSKGTVEGVTTVAERYTPLNVPTLTVAATALVTGLIFDTVLDVRLATHTLVPSNARVVGLTPTLTVAVTALVVGLIFDTVFAP